MNVAFITKRPLWQNILAGILISFFAVAVFLLMLNLITNHGEYLTVPEVKGRNYLETKTELEEKGFEVIIQDSIYVDSLPGLVVIKQFPEPEATIKVNRVIYLTVNCMIPPTIEMPNLIGMSFRNALLELRSLGLKMGDTTFIPDLAKNAVKDQIFNGILVKPGAPIRMGSVIDLLIGSGLGGTPLPVPDLFGLTYLEAKLVMELNGITPGVILLDEGLVDTSLGFVYWQNPLPFDEAQQTNTIRPGQLMDLRISTVKPENRQDTVLIR
ncbi:MAG: PASTA domain-containing protein [Bacteroidetes bacterium]|nr:PASTA domain-containing protein [Bacteroidota bacterium]